MGKQRYLIARVLICIMLVQSVMSSMVYADTEIKFRKIAEDLISDIAEENVIGDIGVSDSAISGSSLEIITESSEIEYEDGIPIYVWDIVRSGKFYNDLSDGQKYLLTEYMSVREDTMGVCCDNGLNIEESISIALIMQRMDIEYSYAIEMVGNCQSVDIALKHSNEFAEKKYEVSIWNDESIEAQVTELAVQGYEINDIAKALLVSETLDKEISDVMECSEEVIESIMSGDKNGLKNATKK